MILSFYDNKKSGDIVLFIHGTASANNVWENQYKILDEMNYRVIGVDLRGHGDSKNPGGECSTDHHILDIKETLDHLELNENFNIVGHSYGAVIAFKYAEKYPDEVSKLLLASLPPKVPKILHGYYKWLLGKPIDLIKRFSNHILKLPLKMRHKLAIISDQNIIRQIWKDSIHWDFLSVTPRVHCPVYFSVGRFDYIALESSIRRLHKKIPNSSYQVFNRASHTCMEDQPHLFNEWILSSLLP